MTTGIYSLTVQVPLTIRRRPRRKTVVTPVREEGATTAIPTRADPAMVKALAWAFRYQWLLDEGRYASISEMAVAEKIERGYLGSKRSDEARLPARALNVLGRLGARGFELTLWIALTTTRRASDIAGSRS